MTPSTTKTYCDGCAKKQRPGCGGCRGENNPGELCDACLAGPDASVVRCARHGGKLPVRRLDWDAIQHHQPDDDDDATVDETPPGEAAGTACADCDDLYTELAHTQDALDKEREENARLRRKVWTLQGERQSHREGRMHPYTHRAVRKRAAKLKGLSLELRRMGSGDRFYAILDEIESHAANLFFREPQREPDDFP